MSQAVIIKSNKYGINLKLDPNMPFPELREAVALKFEESAKFFGHSRLAVSFEGRLLTREEETELVRIITGHSDIDIICIVDADDEYTDTFKEQIASYMDALRGKEGEIYRGTLKAGEALESDNTIVLAGNVEAGARVASKGNIIVMGTLSGFAYAGGSGDEDAYIIALEMDPVQLKIGDYLVKYAEKKQRAKKFHLRDREKGIEKVSPMIATVKDKTIHIDPVSGELFDKVRSFS